MIKRYGKGLHCLPAILATTLILFGISGVTSAQTTVFNDDFSASQGASFTTFGNIGSSNWFISRSGVDWGGRIHNGQLELTNTASSEANANGWVFASVDAASDYSSEYNTVLNQNTGAVIWTFNMRQIRSNPAGFGANTYGVAFVLAADSRNVRTSGKGYAIVMGNTGAPNPVRLVAFEGGIQSVGTGSSGIIVANAPLDDPRDSYISVKVIYNPVNNSWEMLGRVEDSAAFVDPLEGELVSVGTAIDNTHTGANLAYTGGYWQGSTAANETAFFDNVTVRIDEAPDPVPMLFASPVTLSNFRYAQGEGPSDPQSFNLSGSSLDGTDVTISADTDFEISGSATGTYQDEIVLTGYAGSTTPIYARLKQGRSVGQYSEAITITGGGHSGSLLVSLSGEVLPEPTPPDVLTLDGFFEDFDGFLGEGFTPAPHGGQLHSGNWRIRGMSDGDGSFGGTYDFGDFARGISTGGVTTGGTYAFDTGPGITVLGVQPTGTDFTPGTITLRLENESGRSVNYLDVSYDIYTFNDQNRASTFDFAWSLNDLTYNRVSELNYITPEAADDNPVWVKTERSTRLEGLNLAPGGFLYLQWQSEDAGGSGARDEFGLSNLSIDVIDAVEIAGNAGWRMLSIPVEGVTVADLAAQNQVQGITGVAALYGNAAPEGIENDAPNLYTSYEAGWNAPGNVSDVLEIGTGLIWYFYDNDDGISTPLPFSLVASGASPGSDVSTSMHTSSESVDDGVGGTTDVAFNLLGNPFAAGLDISGIADWVAGGSLNSSIVQVWKNDESGWQEGIGHQGEWVLIGGGNNDNTVGAWQGFMVENDDATGIEYPVSARTDGGTFLKEQKLVQKRLVFTLEGESAEAGVRTRDAANLVFDDQADVGWDLLDATQLTPLAGSHATLSFVGDIDGRDVLKVQESQPAGFEGRLELPMAFNVYNMGGDFAISWDGLSSLPSEWQIVLTDLHTGQSVNLREKSGYTFSYGAGGNIQSKASVGGDEGMHQIKPLVLSDDKEDSGLRFRLTVDSEPVSNEIPGDVPQELELSQNYPNPFNPSTVIRYSVPGQAHVRLTVYDMLGREIAVLVNEQQAPGSYDVTWDGTDISSGMYLYRLEAGSKSITRRMTLIK